MLASIFEIKLKLIERNQQINKTQARYLWICTQAVLKANAVGLLMLPPEIFSRISLALQAQTIAGGRLPQTHGMTQTMNQ